jgi:hypothetical protein
LGQSRINRGRVRREELQLEAEERASARASRSNGEQIALLNSRLGLGVGSVRERSRLESMIESEKESKRRKVSKKTREGSKGVEEKSTTRSTGEKSDGRRRRSRRDRQ